MTAKSCWERMYMETNDGTKRISQTKVELWVGFWMSAILFGATVGFQSGFLAIATVVPLSILIRVTTEDLIVRFQHDERELAAGLTSAILGNAIEMCFALVAVARDEALVAQTALTRAVLADCLLSLGTCFLCGGFQHGVQTYPIVMARDKTQLLVLSLASIVLPTVFKLTGPRGGFSQLRHRAVLVFLFYLGYEYHTHAVRPRPALTVGLAMAGGVVSAADAFGALDLPALRAHSLANSRKAPKMPLPMNLAVLAYALAVTVVTSIGVIQSIDVPYHALGVSKSFVGLVIIPAVYGCAEQAVTAIRSQAASIDWIIEVAIDSSIRITLFVLPTTVIVGWATGVEAMSLFFDGFQVTMLGLGVALVNYIMHTGSSHW
ncbi:Vacuolar calcium ion transporter [Talaromyces islandicus]|uniref:Vacuolar calcium ion transporter n=1 Tax=Talaromyces islandicus TaxID=28573 RepID=A0A0U1MBB2_TALIS|nr:Vacuolar calcium ion transporter [Talaromyces islandicus]